MQMTAMPLKYTTIVLNTNGTDRKWKEQNDSNKLEQKNNIS